MRIARNKFDGAGRTIIFLIALMSLCDVVVESLKFRRAPALFSPLTTPLFLLLLFAFLDMSLQ